MYCKVACQIFYSTFAQKKKYSHFPKHSICQKLPKKPLPQKITTAKNYVQVDPNTSIAVKNRRIDPYWPSHRVSRKSDVPLSGNHDFLVPKEFIKKEVLAQIFSCEFCKIFKSTFFIEHLWATASSMWNNKEAKITLS